MFWTYLRKKEVCGSMFLRRQIHQVFRFVTAPETDGAYVMPLLVPGQDSPAGAGDQAAVVKRVVQRILVVDLG